MVTRKNAPTPPTTVPKGKQCAVTASKSKSKSGRRLPQTEPSSEEAFDLDISSNSEEDSDSSGHAKQEPTPIDPPAVPSLTPSILSTAR